MTAPSPRWGLRQAWQLRKLVIALWLVSWAAFVPAMMLIGQATAALTNLPGETTPARFLRGANPVVVEDTWLIIFNGLADASETIMMAVAAGCVFLWLWSVIWHGGVVCWQMWASGRPVKLSELIGLGLHSLGRFLRLCLTAAAALAAFLALIWIPLTGACATAPVISTGWMVLIASALLFSGLLMVVVWAATLRAYWLFGSPQRRSAVLAFTQALVDTFRPFNGFLMTMATLAVWAIPGLVFSALPLLLDWHIGWLRGTATSAAIVHLSGLLRAFCWVGLFASFAPVTGLFPPPKKDKTVTRPIKPAVTTPATEVTS